MKTGSGEICNEFDIVTGIIDKRKIQGRIGQGKGKIKIETVSGNISLLKLQKKNDFSVSKKRH